MQRSFSLKIMFFFLMNSMIHNQILYFNSSVIESSQEGTPENPLTSLQSLQCQLNSSNETIYFLDSLSLNITLSISQSNITMQSLLSFFLLIIKNIHRSFEEKEEIFLDVSGGIQIENSNVKLINFLIRISISWTNIYFISASSSSLELSVKKKFSSNLKRNRNAMCKATSLTQSWGILLTSQILFSTL